jgi:hypothetical protein
MGDWWTSTIGPAAPIVGALLSAIIGGAITLLIVHKRKKLTFIVRKSEDLTAPLKQHHGLISFRFGLRDVNSLNRAAVRVRNTGNTTIKDVKFSVLIFGTHAFHISEISLGDSAIVRGIQTAWSVPDNADTPTLYVSADFLNPKETFEVLIYFDGDVEQPDVSCRMEEVKVAIRQQGEFTETAGQLALAAASKALGIGPFPFR